MVIAERKGNGVGKRTRRGKVGLSDTNYKQSKPLVMNIVAFNIISYLITAESQTPDQSSQCQRQMPQVCTTLVLPMPL